MVCLVVSSCQEKKSEDSENKQDEVAVNYDRFPAEGINVRVTVTDMDLQAEAAYMDIKVLELLGRGQRAPGVPDGTVLKLLLNGEQLNMEEIANASVNDTLSVTLVHTPRRMDEGEETNMNWKLHSIN